MPVIAVINRKGGSGKSTIATHLAAYAANSGISTMLGDIDRQHSSKTWLALRNAVPEGSRPTIMTWAVDVGGALHAPSSVQWTVLDTPGGLYGLELAKVVMVADVVIMPVCNSIFDRESAAMCIAELKQLPKIKLGKCRLGIVGMRIDARTRGAAEIAAWAGEQKVHYVGHIRDVSTYVRCAEMGLTIFDLMPNKVRFDALQWQPILNWLKPYFDIAMLPKSSSANHPLARTRTPILREIETPKPITRLDQQGVLNAAPNRAMHAHDADEKKSFFQSLGLPSFLKKK